MKAHPVHPVHPVKAPWATVRLGEVLRSTERGETVDAAKEYRLLGVRLDGQGPFHRETVMGTQTSAMKLFRVVKGDFIYSRLFACRGAFGVINEELEGCYVSGEFPTFTPVPGKVDVEYLKFWFRLPSVIATVDEDCSGSTPLTRNRFKENFFLALEIPLPPLVEQRRVVARIEALAAQIREARTLRHQAAEEVEALVLRSRAVQFAKLSTQFPNRLLGGLISMASGEGLTSSQMDDSAPFSVYGGGGLNGHYSRYLFEEPKIVMGRVGARCGCVFVTKPKSWITDNALYLTKISGELHSSYLILALMTLDLRQQANQAAQPVVSQKKINPMRIPVPPLPEQRRIVAELDELQAELDGLKRLQAETAAGLEALLPSILDRAFRGEL